MDCHDHWAHGPLGESVKLTTALADLRLTRDRRCGSLQASFEQMPAPQCSSKHGLFLEKLALRLLHSQTKMLFRLQGIWLFTSFVHERGTLMFTQHYQLYSLSWAHRFPQGRQGASTSHGLCHHHLESHLPHFSSCGNVTQGGYDDAARPYSWPTMHMLR